MIHELDFFEDRLAVNSLWFSGKHYSLDKDVQAGSSFDINSSGFRALLECVASSTSAISNNKVPADELLSLENFQGEEKTKKQNELESDYARRLASLPIDERPMLGNKTEACIVRLFERFSSIEEIRKSYTQKLRILHSKTKISLTIVENLKSKNSLRCPYCCKNFHFSVIQRVIFMKSSK